MRTWRGNSRGVLASLVVALALVAGAGLADTFCDAVPHSIARNVQGNSWCEGWSNYWCTYCWDNNSGGNCATNLSGVCEPRLLNPTP
jgi:hypothetical protein